jgi:glycosyltransferase involved in cell wall biosynthesis
MVVPLTAGSGTRFKVLEALAIGLPVVSTPTGVAGLDVWPGRDVVVATLADDLAELAAAAHRADGPQELVRAGRALVTRRYSWPVVGNAVRDRLDGLFCDPGHLAGGS